MATDRDIEYVIKVKDEATKALKGVTVAAAAVVGGLIYMVKAAADAQVEMAKMEAILGTMGKKGKEASEGILKAADAAVQMGFDDEEAAVSLTRLFQRTGDLEQAMKLSAIAMDLARNKGIALSEASNMVGMVMSGNAKILKQYGIELDDTAGPMAALDDLQKKVAGSAEAYSKTLAGQLEILQIKAGNIAETLGSQLIPVLIQFLETITPIIDKTAEWIEKNPELTSTVMLLVGALSGLVLIVKAGLAVLAVLTTTLGAVGLAITGVGVLVFTLHQHWEGLMWMVGRAIDFIKLKVMELLEAIQLAFGSIRDAITGAFQSGLDKAAELLDAFKQRVQDWAELVTRTLRGVQDYSGPALKGGSSKKRAAGGMTSGFTTINEHGAELVSLPRGSYVHTANASRDLMRGMGGVNLSITVNGSLIGLSKRELADLVGEQVIRQLKPILSLA